MSDLPARFRDVVPPLAKLVQRLENASNSDKATYVTEVLEDSCRLLEEVVRLSESPLGMVDSIEEELWRSGGDVAVTDWNSFIEAEVRLLVQLGFNGPELMGIRQRLEQANRSTSRERDAGAAFATIAKFQRLVCSFATAARENRYTESTHRTAARICKDGVLDAIGLVGDAVSLATLPSAAGLILAGAIVVPALVSVRVSYKGLSAVVSRLTKLEEEARMAGDEGPFRRY